MYRRAALLANFEDVSESGPRAFTQVVGLWWQRVGGTAAAPSVCADAA